jgi:hypothetical protein
MSEAKLTVGQPVGSQLGFIPRDGLLVRSRLSVVACGVGEEWVI